jgi:hypothetical protein
MACLDAHLYEIEYRYLNKSKQFIKIKLKSQTQKSNSGMDV